jgi:hypothetical protein
MVIDERQGQVELFENDAPGAAALRAIRLAPEDRGSDGRRLVGHGARSHGGRSYRRSFAWGIGATTAEGVSGRGPVGARADEGGGPGRGDQDARKLVCAGVGSGAGALPSGHAQGRRR